MTYTVMQNLEIKWGLIKSIETRNDGILSEKIPMLAWML